MKELLTKKNLIKHGFLNPTVDKAPIRMAKKKQAATKSIKATIREKAKGSAPRKRVCPLRSGPLACLAVRRARGLRTSTFH